MHVHLKLAEITLLTYGSFTEFTGLNVHLFGEDETAQIKKFSFKFTRFKILYKLINDS